MRTIRTKVYKFNELSKEVQNKVINERITDMLEYESNDHYKNWPEFKKAIDKADEMQTPWFAGSYVWDYCKDAILENINDYEYYANGKLTNILKNAIMNPYYQQVLTVIGETQDGNKINIKDVYGKFLHDLIIENTKTEEINAKGNVAKCVNLEELESNLRYAIHEFTKALKAVERLNEIYNTVYNYHKDLIENDRGIGGSIMKRVRERFGLTGDEVQAIKQEIEANKTTIDISNESLRDVAFRYAEEYPDGTLAASFLDGCHYQKEKDKAIIDKLVKRLEKLCKAIAVQIDDSGNKSKFSLQVTENYNRSIQLLNELK